MTDEPDDKPFMTVPLTPGTTRLDFYVKGAGGGGLSPGTRNLPTVAYGEVRPMTTPSPTPEEIEAAAKRLIAAIDQVENSWAFAIGKAARGKVIDMFMARDDLKAAMAVRRQK